MPTIRTENLNIFSDPYNTDGTLLSRESFLYSKQTFHLPPSNSAQIILLDSIIPISEQSDVYLEFLTFVQ